ncbi:MAG TPA: hypothetical protein VFZ26_00630 [Gemmatimonadales bacterium]
MGELTAADAIALAAVSFAFMGILTGPIGRAIGDRLRGRRPSGDETPLAGEVETLRVRLGEVEERLDFAERLLASGRQVDQISGDADR